MEMEPFIISIFFRPLDIDLGFDKHRLLMMVADFLVEQMQMNIDMEGPERSWPPLSEKYGRWKTKHYPGKGMLRLTDALYHSIHPDVDATQMIAAAETGDLPYAELHEEGGGKVPARPYAYLTSRGESELAMLVENFFESEW